MRQRTDRARSAGHDGRVQRHMVTVQYDELSSALDFVNVSGGLAQHEAYISLDTGAIVWISGDDLSDDTIPDDLETSDRYLPIPHRNDLDLGRELALRFAAEALPQRYAAIQACFRRPGAYACFKALVAAEGRLDDWYRYEADATEQALTAWCVANGIRLITADSARQL